VTPASRITSPLRAMPAKFYDFNRRINAHGKHFAALWFDFVDTHDEDFKIDDLEKFGRDSGLFDGIKVSKLAQDVDDSPLIVTVERGGKSFLLHQVGIGVSQIVPILIETIFSVASDNPHLMMQQPELHLHPVAQAELGSYLAKCCSKGMRPVIETHSSYLIDRFRSEIRNRSKSKIGEKDKLFEMQVIFCERTTEGNAAKYIQVNEEGELVDPPESYHKFFVEELVRTLF
jgi:predicted ATPase